MCSSACQACMHVRSPVQEHARRRSTNHLTRHPTHPPHATAPSQGCTQSAGVGDGARMGQGVIVWSRVGVQGACTGLVSLRRHGTYVTTYAYAVARRLALSGDVLRRRGILLHRGVSTARIASFSSPTLDHRCTRLTVETRYSPYARIFLSRRSSPLLPPARDYLTRRRVKACTVH
jgi:hypothetical protein